MVTWVRFRERCSGTEFYFWNTHLDNAVELARQKGAAMIVERAGRLKPDLPFVMIGDFNANVGNSRLYEILVTEGGFADTWLSAGERGNEKFNSFHGYNTPVEKGLRIDWILARGAVTVTKTEIVTYSEHGQYPSDHFPVAAWLTLTSSKKPMQ